MSPLEELYALFGDELDAAADEALRTGRPVLRWEDGLIYVPDNVVIEQFANGNMIRPSTIALVREGRRVDVFAIGEVTG
jgi:hypothetical protein